MVDGLAGSAEAMLATEIDEALWQVGEHATMRGRDQLLAEQPGDLAAGLTAARVDAGEEAERLIAAAYERVLETLLAGSRRAA